MLFFTLCCVGIHIVIGVVLVGVAGVDVLVELHNLGHVGIEVTGGEECGAYAEMLGLEVDVGEENRHIGFHGYLVEAPFPTLHRLTRAFRCDDLSEVFVVFEVAYGLFDQGMPCRGTLPIHWYGTAGSEKPTSEEVEIIFFEKDMGVKVVFEDAGSTYKKVACAGVWGHDNDAMMLIGYGTRMSIVEGPSAE